MQLDLLPDSTVFFLDECLASRAIVARLREAGIVVQTHEDNLDRGVPDEEWISYVASRGWIAVTKDARIMRRGLERLAVESSGAVLVVLSRGDWSASTCAEALIVAAPRVVRKIAKLGRPVVFSVTASGAVSVKHGERRGGVKQSP